SDPGTQTSAGWHEVRTRWSETRPHRKLRKIAQGLFGSQIAQGKPARFGSVLIQFEDKSSGVCASRRYLPPLRRNTSCQSCSGAESKTSSSDAGCVSHALRFISPSSCPGLQPA